MAVTFAALPCEYAAALWVGGVVIYYSLTSANKPEHTGQPPTQLKRGMVSRMVSEDGAAGCCPKSPMMRCHGVRQGAVPCLT